MRVAVYLTHGGVCARGGSLCGMLRYSDLRPWGSSGLESFASLGALRFGHSMVLDLSSVEDEGWW